MPWRCSTFQGCQQWHMNTSEGLQGTGEQFSWLWPVWSSTQFCGSANSIYSFSNEAYCISCSWNAPGVWFEFGRIAAENIIFGKLEELLIATMCLSSANACWEKAQPRNCSLEARYQWLHWVSRCPRYRQGSTGSVRASSKLSSRAVAVDIHFRCA